LIGRKSRKARKKKKAKVLVNKWNAGDAAIEKKDVKGVRDNEKERMKQKRKVMKELTTRSG
jgi:hypothetical protein